MRVVLRTYMSALFALIAAGCAHVAAPINADIVFENVNVVPMDRETVLADRAVAVRDGVIIAIVRQPAAGRIDAVERIDGGGAFLMPGLADMHVHVRMAPKAAFNLFLANGVTTVRSMGLDEPFGTVDHVALRADVEAGRIDGPRYLISGPQLNARRLPTVAEVAPMLDRHVAEGFDLVKIHGDLDQDVYDALIDGAWERGLRVAGHTQHQMPLAQSLRMGNIEHVEEFLYVSREGFGAVAGDYEAFMPLYFAHAEQLADPAYRALIVADVAASGVYVDPTLIIYKMISVWASPERLANHLTDDRLAYLPAPTRQTYADPATNPYQEEGFPLSVDHVDANVDTLSALVVELHDAGVPLLLGTDALGTLAPGFAVHQELELLVAAGLTPYEALRAGTVNVAAYLDETDKAGTIEVGKRADFALVGGDPLAHVGNAGDVFGVYTRGLWRSRADLASNLVEARNLARELD